MGEKIPEPFRWDESFRTFYQNIDDEHKTLFDGIFDLCREPGSQAAKDTLYKRCVDHFTNEEGMMQKANYANYPPHKAAHEKFLSDLKGVALPVSADQQHWAKDWLVNHIKGTDFKYKGQL
uniref:Hemerythrin n=1 Tax=Euphrosine capensis TaxID=1964454 RepID=A0A1S6QD00_9ANNE|nr:hemerythrin [Euphrosine capensis]